jgi:hypothetical protein
MERRNERLTNDPQEVPGNIIRQINYALLDFELD